MELLNPSTGKPWQAGIATRRDLLFHLAQAIPTLKSRLVRLFDGKMKSSCMQGRVLFVCGVERVSHMHSNQKINTTLPIVPPFTPHKSY